MRLEVYLPLQYSDQSEVLDLIKRAEQIPGLQVTIRSIGSGDLRSFFVGAVPIYLLDGQLLAAGYPPPESFLAALRQRAQAPSSAWLLPAGSAWSPQDSPHAAASASDQGTSPVLLLLDVFRDLTQEELAALSPTLRLKRYAKGQCVYWQGDVADTMFLLRQGRIELHHLTRHGKRLKLGVMRPGMFFGEVCVLGESIRYATAEVVETSQVAIIERAEVVRLIREEPDFALYLVKALSRRLQLSEMRMVTLAYYDVSTRLAAELLQVSQEEQATLLPITHQELADRSGLLRETVTKTLDAFQEEGLVELHRGQVRLRDVRGLRTLLEPLDTENILQG
ncbi:MAG TPA: Crp/Fnr family transcriptional regulator [Ktedonobacterales bacterium]|jgi:CRP/FNR family transcriptional regulator